LYGCDVVFDAETAKRVRAEVSARLGGVCPCEADVPCPLLPADMGTLFLPAPQLRGA
jgi:hypothetical protein